MRSNSNTEIAENSQTTRNFYLSKAGLIYAMLVLIGNGIHPTLNKVRPFDLDSLIFSWQMTLVEFIGGLIVYYFETKMNSKKNLGAKKGAEQRSGSEELSSSLSFRDIFHNKKALSSMLIIGLIFTVATYYYVYGLTITDSVSGALALKTAPIYAIIIGVLFLGEKVNYKQVLLIVYMFFGLFFLATKGTLEMANFSLGMAILLLVPLLWSVGHAIAKAWLQTNQFTTPQVIVFRTGVVFVLLFLVSLKINGIEEIISSLLNWKHVSFSIVFGLIYLVMHISWYKSITLIDLGFASALVIPSPAITSLLAIFITKEPIEIYHWVGMLIMFTGLYGLINSKISKTNSNKDHVNPNNLIKS